MGTISDYEITFMFLVAILYGSKNCQQYFYEIYFSKRYHNRDNSVSKKYF